MPKLPDKLTETRLALQQVAVHVLARRRHAVTGRFGLRPFPGGVGTPAFGDEVEVVRTSGRWLVVERGAAVTTVELTTLAQAAALVDRWGSRSGAHANGPGSVSTLDLGEDFWAGDDTPPMADPDQPLAMDDDSLQVLADWFASGSIVLDEVVATTPSIVDATTRQVWPEHFDLGGAVTLTSGEKANLGASPGDAFEPAPYLYLGPWSEARPGDPAYWNAPFGAVLRYEDRDQAAAFLRRGLELLSK